MDRVSFRRKPYDVIYKDFHNGETVKIRRRPPPKVHQLLPQDVVELSHKKNDDWEQGSTATIKHISYRAPNTLQIMDDEREPTFVSSNDVVLVERGSGHSSPEKEAEDSRYLRWP